MGVVYLAGDQDLGRRVALKQLDRAVTTGTDFEERFQQEARLVASLQHPSIVQIHNLVRVGDDLAIDMAYVERGSLEDAEEKGGLTVYEALCWTRDVLDALASCHEAGIIHRDVKPSNILLAADGRAMLSDFGLAKLLATHQTSSILTRSTATLFVGTPQYAPPESWDGHEPAPSWDVYSTGMVLYEALAAKLPYDADSPFALIKQMIERPVPPLADVSQSVSAELSALVGHMTNRAPDQRPSNAREALEALEQIPEFQGEARQDRAKAHRIAAKPGRRKRHVPHKPGRWLWPALVLVALAVGALAYWAERSARPELRERTSPGHASMKQASAPDELAPYAIFNTIVPATQEIWPAHWLMAPAGEPGQWDVVAHEATRLWSMRVVEMDGRYSMDGHWAEYADETARVFRHGSLTGSASWLSANEEMSVSLELHSGQDGSRWTQLLILQRAAQNITPRAFAHRIEEADCIPSLIYNELMPRNLTWAEPVEHLLAEFSGSLATVPRLSGRAGGIELDGRLHEAEWRLGPLSGDGLPGRLPGRGPQGDESFMMLRYGDAGLYIALQTPATIDYPQVSLGLLGLPDVPTGHSPRWSALIDDDEVVASRYVHRGEVRHWDCAWQVGTTLAGMVRQWEVFIPFGGDAPSAPHAGDRWRINCAVGSPPDANGDNGATRHSPLWWGDEDPGRLEHGAVLVFGNEDVFGKM